MTWPASPGWLLELQASFGALLRSPLDRSTGALRAETSAYEAALVDAVRSTEALGAAERLAIYHRQYWFRLLTVMQGLYPLTARLLGYWHFNDYAARHLRAEPPGGFDIDAVGGGFCESLERALPASGAVNSARGQVEGAAVLDAARIDAAFHRVTRAPRSTPFAPSVEDAARFATSCLELSGSVALLQERWPLCEPRLTLMDQPSDDPISLSERLSAPRSWLLARHGSKVGLRPLEPAEAQLLSLLQDHPLERALGLLESAAPEAERANLPERAQVWLAASVRNGVWAGFADARKSPETELR